MSAQAQALEVDSEEVSEYIRSILVAVQNGVPNDLGFFMSGPVRIRIGLRNEGEKEGGIRVAVVGVGGKRSKEENASIEFEVVNPNSAAVKELMEKATKAITDSIHIVPQPSKS